MRKINKNQKVIKGRYKEINGYFGTSKTDGV